MTGIDSPAGEIGTNTALGALLLLTLPLVMRALVALRAGLARGLLTNRTAALRARTTELATARRAAVDAEAQTLRRVERDLHDGPQQRLVRLDMDLETLGRRLDDDPEAARLVLAEALARNREALAELRALSRGIAPPILADRGLAEADHGGRRAVPGPGDPRRRPARRPATRRRRREHRLLRGHRGPRPTSPSTRALPGRAWSWTSPATG